MENSITEQVKMKEIDQLHCTLMEFNKNSIEVKKLCATFFTTVPALLYKLNDNSFKWEFFAVVLVLSIAFWLLDSHYYYNQKNVRSYMKAIQIQLLTDKESVDNNEKEKGKGRKLDACKLIFTGACKSIFNCSNIIYIFFVLVSGGLMIGSLLL
jgi:hypothetical protein